MSSLEDKMNFLLHQQYQVKDLVVKAREDVIAINEQVDKAKEDFNTGNRSDAKARKLQKQLKKYAGYIASLEKVIILGSRKVTFFEGEILKIKAVMAD